MSIVHWLQAVVFACWLIVAGVLFYGWRLCETQPEFDPFEDDDEVS